MKMGQTTRLALMALVTAVLLAACSGPTGSGPGPEAADGTFVLSLTVKGAGTVLIDEVDLSCRDSCTARVGRDVSVRLVAEPDAGLGFAGWGQDCSGLDECTVHMDSDVDVSAEFSSNVLALRFDGDGEGSARIVPPDVSCSDDCGQSFSAPLNASISVSTGDGTSVQGWGGVCSDAGTGRYCQVHVEGQTDVRLTLVHPPVADDDAYDVNEDETLTVAAASGVLSNDSDSAGDSLTAELLSQPSKGSVDLRSDGSFTYTPRPDENGQDSFSYRARDEFGNVSASANVSILIHGVNEPLFPIPLSMTVMEDEAETGTLQASGGEGDLTYSMGPNEPDHGEASVSGTTATYTPDADFFGEDAFTFRVEDSSGQSGTATVSIDVVPVNDAPEFTLSSNSVESSPGASETKANFATNISTGPANESGQTPRFEVIRRNGNLTFATAPAIDADGTLTFEIADGSSGSADFDVILYDDGGTENGGQDESQARVLTITAESTIPPLTAESMSMSMNEDASQTKTLQGSGGDGNLTYSVVSGPSRGNVAIAGSEATYTPNDDYFGNDQFTYKVTDGSGQEDTAEVSIVVSSVNDPPVFTLSDTSVETSAGASESIAGFATGISPGATNESGQTVTFEVTSTGGDLQFATAPAIDSSGTLTFEVAPDGSGSAQFEVVLRDDGGTENGGQDTSQVRTLTFTAESTASSPTANSMSMSLNEDDSQTKTLQGSGGDGSLTYSVHSGPSHGDVAIAGSEATYSPDGNYFGSDQFVYKVTDESGQEDSAEVSIEVESVNDPPVFALSDTSVETSAGASETITGFATGISPGATNESEQTVTFELASTGGDLQFSTPPAIDASGTLTFEVAADGSGSAQFEAVLRDDGGVANGGDDESDPESFEIFVPAQALEAESASYALREDDDLEITLSSSGGDGTTRTYAIATAPANGQALPAEGNPVSYAPDPDYFGSDDFEFSVEDEAGTKDLGVITLTVESVNDVPAFDLPDPLVEVSADSGSHSFPDFAANLSPGAANESEQTLTFQVDQVSTTGMTFVSEPSLTVEGTSGTLSFEVADGNSGEADFEAVLRDDGGTENGGADRSEPKLFTIRVSTT